MYTNDGATKDSPPLRSSRLANNKKWALVLSYVLICLYVAPIVLFTFALLATSGFKESHWALTWFVAFASNHDGTLNEFHKVLLPVIAAVSTATFSKQKPGALVALSSTILFFFFWTVAVSVTFDIPSIADSIDSSVDNYRKEGVGDFFSRVREMLLTFAMMLLGIQVSNKTTK